MPFYSEMKLKKMPKINLSLHGALQSLMDNSHNLKSKLHIVPTSFSTFVNLPKQGPQTELPWRLNHLPLNMSSAQWTKVTWQRAQGNFGLCLFVPGYLSSHKKYIFSLQTHQHKPLQQVQIFTWERKAK